MQPENCEKLAQLLNDNPRYSCRFLSEELGILKETVRDILTLDLKMRKLCSVWVSHDLTENNKQQRVTAAQGILDALTSWDLKHLVCMQWKMNRGSNSSQTREQMLGWWTKEAIDGCATKNDKQKDSPVVLLHRQQSVRGKSPVRRTHHNGEIYPVCTVSRRTPAEVEE